MRYNYCMSLGIILAFVAMVAWAVDDFLIGKTSKRLGSLPAIFCMSTFCSIVLLPFAVQSFSKQTYSISLVTVIVVVLLLAITFIATFCDFEALRKGKLAIIDPIYAFEIPITATLALVFLGELLNIWQIILAILVTIGVITVSTNTIAIKKIKWERGVRLAILSTIFMGGMNFLMAVGGRLTSPVAINFIIYTITSLCLLGYLIYTGKLSQTLLSARQHIKLVVTQGTVDLIAWTSFTTSATLLPIAITTGISEAYIGLAVILGIFINKEKIKPHQTIGILTALIGAILLALTINT